MVLGNNAFRRFTKFIRGDNSNDAQKKLTKALNQCSKKILLEYTEVGTAVYLKYRIVLSEKSMKKTCDIRNLYGLVCYSLSLQILDIRLKEYCYIGYRVEEDNGDVISTPLYAVNDIYSIPEKIFHPYSYGDELEGEFHLEVLFVDPTGYRDPFLRREYLNFISTKLTVGLQFPSIVCMKKMVKKADNWVEALHRKIYFEYSSLADMLIIVMAKYPRKAQQHTYWFAERLEVFSEDVNIGSMVLKVFKKKWEQEMTQYTHVMFEVRTLDENHIAVTKLQHHKYINEYIISEEISWQLQIRDYSFERFILTIYAVNVPEFATSLRAPSLVSFVRRSVEACKNTPGTYELEECTEPFTSNCNCKKLHLHDYCNFEMITATNYNGNVACRWLIHLSDLSKQLYFTVHVSELYARIVNQLTRNSFSTVFDMHTIIKFEIDTEGVVYSSRSYHHSEFVLPTLFRDIVVFMRAQTVLFKKFAITVCVSKEQPIDANKELYLYIYRHLETETKINLIDAETNTDIEVVEMPPTIKAVTRLPAEENIIILEKEPAQRPPTNNTPNKHGRDALTLRSRLFKKDSILWKKAVILPLPTKDAYKILSSKIKINTSKGRITELLVEPNQLFCDEMLNNSLLIAYICLHIVKTTEISFCTEKKKKITLKLLYDQILLQAVLSENDCWNPEILKNDMFREKSLDITAQFKLEVLYRAR